MRRFQQSYSVFDGNGRKVYPEDTSTAKKSVDAIADEVIRGDWGNGDGHYYYSCKKICPSSQYSGTFNEPGLILAVTAVGGLQHPTRR